jgi:hypothetical protein
LEKGWVKLLSVDCTLAELKCAVLREHQINAVVINRQDSSYLFGEADLYVPQDEIIHAKRILDEENG